MIAIPARWNPSLVDASQLQVPFGLSQWRMRGAAMQQLFTMVKARGGSFHDFVATLPDPSLRAFWSQRIQALEWYDIWALILALRTLSDQHHLEFRDVLTDFGYSGAKFNLTSGTHKLIMKVVKLETVGKHLGRMADFLWKMYEGSETRATGPGRVEVDIFGAPLMPGAAALHIGLGFMRGVLDTCGAKNTEVTRMEFSEREGTSNEPVFDLRFELSFGR